MRPNIIYIYFIRAIRLLPAQVVPGDEPPEFVEKFSGWEYGPDFTELLTFGDTYQVRALW